MRTATSRPRADRRGLTLVELMVTVALMLLIMTVIVAIFRAATGAMTTASTDQELATVTRRLDTTLRQDLAGATARFTPPLNPKDGLGYFEFIENAPADNQGEDIDDILAFTSKAPAGQPFTGRVMLPYAYRNFGTVDAPIWKPTAYAPTVVTSQYAELIYFLRHGNLYRRVMLIAPERKGSLHVDVTYNAAGVPAGHMYPGGAFSINGELVGWQGANDISVHAPAPGSYVPVPNTLGDLTNRENRSFRPGFSNDYVTVTHNGDGTYTISNGPDGVADDLEYNGSGNGVPDYYPTHFTDAAATFPRNRNADTYSDAGWTALHNPDTHGFPYVFPGAYSYPNPSTGYAGIARGPHLGPWVKAAADADWRLNHSPLDLGDNLPIPPGAPPGGMRNSWTFWGIPTWRETRSPLWVGPLKRLDEAFSFTLDLPDPLADASYTFAGATQPFGLSRMRTGELLPQQKHWYSDNAGMFSGGDLSAPYYPIPSYSWEEDLLATNVRSFDVKAFDPNRGVFSIPLGANVTPAYVDLGYAASAGATVDSFNTASYFNTTFGMDGRMPPFVDDYRVDPQWPGYNVGYGTFATPGTATRMTRTWDSWSTDYTRAPFSPINPFNGAPFSAPTYFSYPPPYPAPLYGLQIQIRVHDQPNEGGSPRVKVLTIRQDFTNKL